MTRKLKTESVKRKTKTQNFKLLVLGFALCALRFALCEANAQSIPSAELINNAKSYDGKNVTYSGEIVGDIMARGDFAWVNINDATNAVGVWINRALLKEVVYTGGYKTRGDWVEVTGVFHRACPQHGGDLDIHAQTLKKIASGRSLQRALNIPKRNLAFVLLGILIIALILSQAKGLRERS